MTFNSAMALAYQNLLDVSTHKRLAILKYVRVTLEKFSEPEMELLDGTDIQQLIQTAGKGYDNWMSKHRTAVIG